MPMVALIAVSNTVSISDAAELDRPPTLSSSLCRGVVGTLIRSTAGNWSRWAAVCAADNCVFEAAELVD